VSQTDPDPTIATGEGGGLRLNRVNAAQRPGTTPMLGVAGQYNSLGDRRRFGESDLSGATKSLWIIVPKYAQKRDTAGPREFVAH